ncbi:MAG: Acetoin utilization protein AcuB [Thermacetogenium phaeum]|uniref:Acetoin utilization protein AcuB n=1 Tax=Thermacetogenium phaeum TaxID=85874 RepID=A0A117LBM4_9THEO|nr:MAG: Acetoin utilization protein AcuB [Thermacetogenium phaeum]
MRVRDKMTPDPITITPKTTVAEALDLMRENKVRRLPVLDKGKLVGIVTDRDLCEVSPSPATSLSIFELNYLLARTKIGEIIKKQQVITIEPDAYLEEAALIMRDNQIGAIPVVENGKLVGIITESDIFDAFIELMGLREPGMRLELELEDEPGMLVKAVEIIWKQGGVISHIAVFRTQKGKVSLVIQLQSEEKGTVVAALENEGINVRSVAWKGHATIR